MGDKTDAELVERTAAGEREAYADLVRRYASRVYAVCFAMLRDPDDSQDVAQEAFLRGLTRIGSLRDGSQFPGWITRIAQNLCRDRWRAGKRRRELLQEHEPGFPRPPEGLSDEMSDALEKLPEQFRIPLLLYYFDGQSTENLARALSISRAGASTRLARARRALRELLEETHA